VATRVKGGKKDINHRILEMGQAQTAPKKYGIFVGDPRAGESAVLYNARKQVEDRRNPDDSLMLNRLM
jgi:hypothetical protein